VLWFTQRGVFFFGVTTPRQQSGTVAAGDRASGAALAAPRVADPVEDVAPKLSARLLQTYGADSDGMKGHAA
jgi:hypothetical protein